MSLHSFIVTHRNSICCTVFLLLTTIHSAYAAEGYATRYWDGCKPHCAWYTNANGNPVKSCNLYNEVNPLDTAYDYTASSCDGGDAYTCWNMAPQAISDSLSYGYAAVSADGATCGSCYQLTFTGAGYYNESDTGSVAIEGKQMILMATNIGYDVNGTQFDLLIPGGGVGAFNACSTQWSTDDLGEQYGGYLTECQYTYGYDDYDSLKSCVQNKCTTVFSQDGMEDLKAGCDWFVDWFALADNPKFEYQEVDCPSELTGIAYDVSYESDSDTDTDSDSDTNTESDSDSDSDTNTESDSDSDSSSTTETDSDSGSDTTTKTDSDSVSDSNNDSTSAGSISWLLVAFVPLLALRRKRLSL
ncbi:GlyGly-CTERM sorting domain-containing protein [Reinekea marinisedimentorum]|uniref:Cellulase n=1 Tax=Reinekea marinisedimentorum TaxID=230495 RepID=A0A4R3HZ37_9GAMM|nr:GlyGly-CTERM sorting domain-containing protein [Reinekea marinisedimentorum]TCS36769.1 putative secreted protein [Reinekea marinisedimentorum]